MIVFQYQMFNLEIFLDWYGYRMTWILASSRGVWLRLPPFWIHLAKLQNWAFWPICQAPINVQRLLPQPKKLNMDPHAGWICKDFEKPWWQIASPLMTDCISQPAFQKILDWIVPKVPAILQWKWQKLMHQVSWMKQCSRLEPQHEVVAGFLIILSNNNWREVSKTTYLQNLTKNCALTGKPVIFPIMFCVQVLYKVPMAVSVPLRVKMVKFKLPNSGNILAEGEHIRTHK